MAFLLFLLCPLLLAMACDGDSSANSGVIVSPAGTPAPGVPVPTPTLTATEVAALLHGFSYPIPGGCLPSTDTLMPNAPRIYRNGVHEGVDFYDVDNCTRIRNGTPVVAAKEGVVIRADLGYTDLTPAELARYEANPNTPEAIDKFRGRQVWVDHGNGIVTRYCHLSAIAPGIGVGAQVVAGQQLGAVGESGTPATLTAPGSEFHLHFEVRIGDSFLGKDLPPAQVRSLYRALFAP